VSFDAAMSDALHTRVRAFIAGGSGERYQALALPAFARLCAAAGVDPEVAATADRLPALPTDAFRYARIAAHPPELDLRVFQTSGTSRGAELRGAHPLRTLKTYETAALAWARPMLLAGPPLVHAIVMVPDPAMVPDSSLGFMVGLFVDRLGLRATFTFDRERGVDVEAVAGAAERAARDGRAAIVFSTAFALAAVCDALRDRTFSLPSGSRVMVTGGFKGRSREVPAASLYEQAARVFGVQPSHVVGEYGMTELSSQLYEPRFAAGEGAIGVYRPPPWLRVSAADPETLEPLPAGREGIARFVDLANVDGVVAVQTLDWVAVDAAGDVTLFGRAPGAEPRGCSLVLEDLFGGGDAGRGGG
jgi:hypothetical protein